MRIQAKHSESGSILAFALVATLLIGITMGSYLHLVSNQNLSVVRSQSWNSAIPIAEAGLEEAMAHLNANTTNRTADGWALDATGTNVFKERTIGESKYKVYIPVNIDPPEVIAEAYVRIPKSDQFINPPRRIRVVTTNDALFAKGMVAKGQIDLAGNKIRTDSFDSSDPLYSTGGQYDPAKNKDGGDVATNSSVTDSLNVWNAEIMGRASTGPGGNVRLGQNGSVGSKQWHLAGKKGLQEGWSSDDMNVYFPDVKQPWTGGVFAPSAGIQQGISYTYLLTGGRYQLTDLQLSGGEKVLITAPSILLVTHEIKISGNGGIIIAPGASLQIFMAGQKTSITGNGIVNGSGYAANFSYWGLDSNTEINMGGNAALLGTIYAPYADLTLGGGGSNNYDFIGAAVAKSVKLNGHYNFHYDESLKFFGPRRGYTVTFWSEETGS
ncbi:MAG: DUF7305 domain-containing protein [Verrucomicrobiales bacterium]